MAISENYDIERQDEWVDGRACSTEKQIIATDNLRGRLNIKLFW